MVLIVVGEETEVWLNIITPMTLLETLCGPPNLALTDIELVVTKREKNIKMLTLLFTFTFILLTLRRKAKNKGIIIIVNFHASTNNNAFHTINRFVFY